MCALSGGRLIQDMRHNHRHLMEFRNGTILSGNSTHHQMQWPYQLDPKDYSIIAWAEAQDRSPYLLIEEGEYAELKGGEVDPEIVYYKNTDVLAIQGHPEMIIGTDYSNTCLKIIQSYLDGKIEEEWINVEKKVEEVKPKDPVGGGIFNAWENVGRQMKIERRAFNVQFNGDELVIPEINLNLENDNKINIDAPIDEHPF